MRLGMVRVRGITQIYLPPTRLSKNEMNHRAISIYQMAPSERGSAHLITAHYSFIDLERMKG